MRRKHVPLRTCISCKTIANKRDMIRIVKSTDNTIEVDLTGKKPGRGAYLCPRTSCWQSVVKGRQLQHALRSTTILDSQEYLLQYSQQLES